MTKQKSFKRRVRARMEKTSESYTTSRLQLLAKSQGGHSGSADPIVAEGGAIDVGSPPTHIDTGVQPSRTSNDAIRNNTGKEWDEWIALIDAWGGNSRKHTEIARWLSQEHGVPGWWAQNITVTYEQVRGLRIPGQEADGTFSVSASKTVAVPVERLFDAFADDALRERWLPGERLEVTTSRAPKSFRAKWGEGGSARLEIGFYPKGEAKSMVGMGVSKLPDPDAAKQAKAFWTERLKVLKEALEA